MYLELAENYLGAKRKKSHVIHTPRTYEVSGYKRGANYVPAHERRYLNEAPENPYIFVPNFEQGGGVYVREDKFDNMPDDQYKIFMKTLAPYQPEVQQGMSENYFLGSRAERKAQRERRMEAKTQKKEGKGTAKTERQERKKLKAESKASARTTRADAKKTKAEGGGGGVDWDKVKDVGGSLIGKFINKDGGGEPGGADVVTETPFYKKPAVIFGGVAVLLIGGYMLMKKK